ncbi:MAG: tRNA lysidine(34) synthetase TilS [Flavobacteriales bacterium]|nr:tRNA lysidine(34) synthetase TilS [Flavobacteriales bacterium]
MLTEVQRFVAREGLLAPSEPVLVGVSGGVDSMVLLHVLRALEHTCTVVHVDHGLRGAESDTDSAFVEAHCRERAIECVTERVDVRGKAGEGQSIQMVARELRYAVFERVLTGKSARKMALAHHADDSVETLLMNLMRGTGVAGWRGIPPMAGRFVRPLLSVGRAAILEYASKYKVPFREDSSNTDPHYLRNRVRNELLPLMEQLRPGARNVLARDADDLRRLTSIVETGFEILARSISTGPDGSWFIGREPLLGCGAPELFLRWWSDKNGPMHPHVATDLCAALRAGRVGAQFHSCGSKYTIERDGVRVESDSTPSNERISIASDLVVPVHAALVLSKCSTADIDLSEGPRTAWLDASRLSFPLMVRTWEPADRMRPIGLGGSKLVSDILTDAKVPNSARQKARVLLSDGVIVWLLGHRLADGFAASGSSSAVLKLEDLA